MYSNQFEYTSLSSLGFFYNIVLSNSSLVFESFFPEPDNALRRSVYLIVVSRQPILL